MCALALIALTISAPPALGEVLISVDKSTQQMSVSVDGVPRYRFAVSTGRHGDGRPNGTYHPQHLAASWFSKMYYNSPMPHSIFSMAGMPSTAATRLIGSADLPHMAASVCTQRTPRVFFVYAPPFQKSTWMFPKGPAANELDVQASTRAIALTNAEDRALPISAIPRTFAI